MRSELGTGKEPGEYKNVTRLKGYKFSLHYILKQLVVGSMRPCDLRSSGNPGSKWPDTQRAGITHVSLLTVQAFHWRCTMNTYIWETKKLP